MAPVSLSPAEALDEAFAPLRVSAEAMTEEEDLLILEAQLGAWVTYLAEPLPRSLPSLRSLAEEARVRLHQARAQRLALASPPARSLP